MNGSFLQPCTSEWSVGQLKPDGTIRPVGDWTDEIEVEPWKGRSIVRRTQTATFAGARLKYVNVVDRETMAPILSAESSAKGSCEQLAFDGIHVKYRRTATPTGGAIEEKDIQLTMPVFQFAGMFGMLLVTFPLHAGTVFKFPSFDVRQADHVEWLSFRVKGQEVVPAGAGKEAEAWIVESEPQPGARFRFSLRREAPYVIRLDHEKDGTILRWALV